MIDSVYVYRQDSVYVRERKDTVFVDRTRTNTVYRERLRVDTLRTADTLRVVGSVRETVEVETNRLTGWQWFQVWCGRLWIAGVVFTIIYLLLKWKLK